MDARMLSMLITLAFIRSPRLAAKSVVDVCDNWICAPQTAARNAEISNDGMWSQGGRSLELMALLSYGESYAITVADF